MTLSVRRTVTGLAGLALVAGAVAVAGAPSNAASSKTLNGTFRLTPGSFKDGKARGTWFRMINPGGKGYFANPDSRAKNRTYTLGRPGTDGGLATGRFQSHPDPPFDGKGNARAKRIIQPESYTAINFSVATLKKDPQSKKTVSVTSASVDGKRLTVRVPGYTAEWNKQYFNQGAPKPDGSGRAATGTYNSRTRRFVLEWTSKISGGAFNGFSGFWHLEGKFSPR
ncbi:MAG TPA: hypothetical protein VMY78_10220 [Solirubrobacteraceae bacterium]|nr:hypothetical protein [Solirubrobacteraceae bacterium]